VGWGWTELLQDKDKQNKKQNIICVGHHHTQDTRQRQTKQKTQHRKPKRSTTLSTPTPLQHLNTNVYKVCLTYFNQQNVFCLRPVSCLPDVADFSGLPILDLPLLDFVTFI
jgi:hypothetical protein